VNTMRNYKINKPGNNCPEPSLSVPLRRLVRLLGNDFMTVRELARKTKASRVQVYRRLEALRSHGVQLAVAHVREGQAGPQSKAFKLMGAR
jgi:biotin operon repressor